MINYRAAVLIVERELNRRTESRFVVFDELTIRRNWGWVLFYGTEKERYLSDPGTAAAQYAPFLVNRVNSELQQAGKAWPIEKYIEDYETRLASLYQT